MKIKRLIAAITLATAGAVPAHGAVDATEAARLGAELTPTGGIQAGNADGSIPAWTGGGIGSAPAGYEPGSGDYSDPFEQDEILYTITADNLDQYADLLSEALAVKRGRKVGVAGRPEPSPLRRHRTAGDRGGRISGS